MSAALINYMEIAIPVFGGTVIVGGLICCMWNSVSNRLKAIETRLILNGPRPRPHESYMPPQYAFLPTAPPV